MPPEDETSGGMATLYGPPVADEGPVPAYGVPMPPKDDKKDLCQLTACRSRLKTRRRKRRTNKK